MDMKNFDISKLNEVGPGRVKVLLAFSGRLDSVVAAFMLKKQGFEVAAVTFDLWPVEVKNKPWKDFATFCSIDDMNVSKQICDKLGIPFYAVNAQDGYYDRVVEPMISYSLVGKIPPICHWCQEFKLRLLEEKRQLLGYHLIATGHYAKVYKNHSSGEFNVFSASDLKEDQSSMLMGLGQNILSRLLLPLADLRKQEALKIIENFKLDFIASHPNGKNGCYINHPRYVDFVEEHAPENMRMGGHIIHKESTMFMGDHLGIHCYRIGDENLKTRFNSSALENHHQIVGFDLRERYIYVNDAHKNKITELNIVNLRENIDLDKTRSTKLYMHYKEDAPKVVVTISFKNNNSANVFFSEPLGLISPGAELVFYSRPTVAAKAVLKGTVFFVGKLCEEEVVEDNSKDALLLGELEKEKKEEKKEEFQF